ncbi:MAG TPA: hypothetical protein VMZ91_07150 [Candidatus Paceibacterota bacterium]|nr:hypothetical protein [Candidatus Paceibacterota bacterium]
MKTNGKVHLQCGWEPECKNKDCLKCRRQVKRYNLQLTLAEQIVIEDFAVCDLKTMVEEKFDDLDLMQNIMMRILVKIFNKKRMIEMKK